MITERDRAIVIATVRRIIVAANLASNGRRDVPLAAFNQGLIALCEDPKTAEIIIADAEKGIL